jgi:hypothetical protein
MFDSSSYLYTAATHSPAPYSTLTGTFLQTFCSPFLSLPPIHFHFSPFSSLTSSPPRIFHWWSTRKNYSLPLPQTSSRPCLSIKLSAVDSASASNGAWGSSADVTDSISLLILRTTPPAGTHRPFEEGWSCLGRGHYFLNIGGPILAGIVPGPPVSPFSS